MSQYKMSDVPGFAEAVKLEKDFRDAAFLNLPFDVCGIEIRQMTPRLFLILEHLQLLAPMQLNPTHAQLEKFLWIMAEKQGFRWLHSLRVLRMDYDKAMARLARYFQMTFMDTPGGSASSPSLPSASWVAHNCEYVGNLYGWEWHYVIDQPLRVLNQLVNIAKQRENPNYKVHGLHGEILRQRLERKNEELRAKLLKEARQSLVDLLARRAHGL